MEGLLCEFFQSILVEVLEKVLKRTAVADGTLQLTNGLGNYNWFLLSIAVQTVYEVYVAYRQ